MSKLQQRLRDHRYQQKKKLLLRKTSRVLVAAFLLYLLPYLPPTHAFFTSQAETGPAGFRATAFADNLGLSPGEAMTNNSPGEPGPAFFVAQVVNGQIKLDFGTYPVVNKRNFPNVLRLENISTRILTLHWHFSESLAQFFEPQAAPITINPGQQVELDFKLDTSPTDQAGEYFGTLHISALNGFITWELPVRLRLVDKGKPANKDDQDSTAPAGQADSENIYQEEIPAALTLDEGVYGQLPDAGTPAPDAYGLLIVGESIYGQLDDAGKPAPDTCDLPKPGTKEGEGTNGDNSQ